MNSRKIRSASLAYRLCASSRNSCSPLAMTSLAPVPRNRSSNSLQKVRLEGFSAPTAVVRSSAAASLSILKRIERRRALEPRAPLAQVSRATDVLKPRQQEVVFHVEHP